MRIELAEHRARIDGGARLDRDASDATGDGGAHLVLHLHRLDDHDGRVGRDVVALGHEHADDAARHRRAQRAAVVAASRAATDVGERGLLRGHHGDLVHATLDRRMPQLARFGHGHERARARARRPHRDATTGADRGLELQRADAHATTFAEHDVVVATVDPHTIPAHVLHAGRA